MQSNSSTYQIPSFAKREAYNFDGSEDAFKVYQELNAIAEEIEKCRSRNI